MIGVEAATGVTGQMKKEDADKAGVTIKFDSGAEHVQPPLAPQAHAARRYNDVIGLRQGNRRRSCSGTPTTRATSRSPTRAAEGGVRHEASLRRKQVRWKAGRRRRGRWRRRSCTADSQGAIIGDVVGAGGPLLAGSGRGGARGGRCGLPAFRRRRQRSDRCAAQGGAEELGRVERLQHQGADEEFDDGSGGEAIGSGKLENATLELDEFRELVIGLRGGMKLM